MQNTCPCLPVAVAYSSAYRDDHSTKSDPGAVAEKAWRITAAHNSATGGAAASVRATSDGSLWVVVTNPSECDPAIHGSCRSYYQQHHIHTWIYTSALHDAARDIRFTFCPHCVIRGINVWTFILDSYQCCISSSCSNHIFDDWTTWGIVLCFIWSLHYIYLTLQTPAVKVQLALHHLYMRLNTLLVFFFHIHTVHLDIIKVSYSPTDAQVKCLKKQY